MGSIEAALAAIDSLQPGDKLNYAYIARIYGVEPTTLARRHKGVSTSKKVADQNRKFLSPQQEQELVAYIEGLTEQGLPPTRSMVRNFAAQVAGREPGKQWVDRFIKRYQNQLNIKWTTGIDNNRHIADSEKKYKLYFSLLEQKIQQYSIEARHTYNMDEKGFLLGVMSRSKRVFSKASLEAGKARSLIQDGNREWTTVVACICGDGTYLEPSLIYQSDSGDLQDSWLQALDTEFHQARFAASPSGWTNNELGLAWLEQVFDRRTKEKARQSYRLLILDGHGSHVTMDFIEYCNQHKILLAIYPPHSTHTLQPLDVCMFKPLSSAYSMEINSFMQRSQGLTSMSKRDFFPLFWNAWEASFKEETIVNAFRATGIVPLDPHVILKRFTTTASSGDSDSSSISPGNWLKTERLFRKAVPNSSNPPAQKLSQILHKFSVHAAVLEHEVEGLREALISERLRRKRGKPLPLQEPSEYHGGAVFWSPRKVKEARDKLQQKEAEQQQQQHQKAEAAQLRDTARKAKAEEQESRRQARLKAQQSRKELKAKEAANKASRQAARKAQQQLQEARKTAQKGKKRSLNIARRFVPKKVLPKALKPSAQPSRAVPPESARSSRMGRKIMLPAKYK